MQTASADSYSPCMRAEDWPYTVRELLGPKSASTMYGQHHVQMRKTFAPSFTPKAMAAKTARLVKGAQQVCAEMADAATPKGEDAMKRFAFKVTSILLLSHLLTVLLMFMCHIKGMFCCIFCRAFTIGKSKQAASLGPLLLLKTTTSAMLRTMM